MDPATLAVTAIAAAVPYIVALGQEAAKSAAGEVGKSIWEWVKGKLTSAAGQQVVKDLEAAPDDTDNRKAAELALSKLLRSDPNAHTELAQMLDKANARLAALSATAIGNENIIAQVSGSGTVSIKGDKTA
jgi:hypothetical protein